MVDRLDDDPSSSSNMAQASTTMSSSSSESAMDVDRHVNGFDTAANTIATDPTQQNHDKPVRPNTNGFSYADNEVQHSHDTTVKQEPIGDILAAAQPSHNDDKPANSSSSAARQFSRHSPSHGDVGPSSQRTSVTPTKHAKGVDQHSPTSSSSSARREGSSSSSAMSVSPAKSNASNRSRSATTTFQRPAPTFVSSRDFAPLPADPPARSTARDGGMKRSERKSKTDAISAMNGKDGSGDANPPTSAHHPSRKPLGPLTATYSPLPLYAPPDHKQRVWRQQQPPMSNGTSDGDNDVKMNSAPASAPATITDPSSSSTSTTASIPTHHDTPRVPPPRQRSRLFDLPEAPTFYPTAEEFADPLKYIKWIGEPDGGNGKAYGIVKVVPPPGWNPTFVLDQQRFRFRTRVQRLNSLSADARASLNYQEQLQKFHAQQGHNRVSIPVVDRRPVDLYQLKLVVASYGGYDDVARQRKWAEVTRRLGYDEKESCHLAAQIKAAYSRIIYPFEHFLRANREASKRFVAPASSSATAAAADKTPSIDGRGQSVEMAITPPPQQQTNVADEETSVPPDSAASGVTQEDVDDSTSNGNSRRRSSRRKTDPKDTPVILSQRARRKRQPSPPPHGTNGDFYIAPGAEEQMCEICLRGDDGVSMLLCDECNRGYHMFCLDPPLTAIPRSEWYCPPCLVGTGNDYGFDDGETHSLSSFWKRADAFRAAWWTKRAEEDVKVEKGDNDDDEEDEGGQDDKKAIWQAENGKPNGVCRTVNSAGLQISEDDVEREFWRLVHNPDETVEVEYGADVHSTTHGSALPTLETHPLDPYSRDGWNLNNLPILNGSLLRYIKSDISGMTVPWVYVGMMFSTFCWHNEDHYTYSINYQHFGDTKTWYGIPGEDAHRLEDALRKAAPDLFEQSPDLLFQLVTMMSPDKLRKEGVNVYAIDQRANEFVITFPKAYHSGFNQGFNLNEAVNFALPDWIDMDLECIQRYQQYNRFPVFSHDELLVTVYQHSQTVDTAMWLQHALREMVEREIGKRDSVRSEFVGITEALDETDQAEADYQCAHCNIFCYLSQITSPKADGVACLDHGSQVCGKDMPSSWTLRVRFGDDQLQAMLSKTVERASVPANWQARLHKVIVANARPPLRSLRGLLNEGEKIPYPIAEMDELREFVEKANRWVDEATTFIAKRHQKRAATATKDASGRRSGKRLSRAGAEDDDGVANTDEVEQLGEPERVYVLLTEAELLPFDAPEISALHAVVEQMEEFKHRAKELLKRVNTAKPPKPSECDEVISLGSPLSVKLSELEALQTYVSRCKWLSEIEEARYSFFTLDEVDSYIEEGRSFGVSDDDELMILLHERRQAGLLWRERAESVLDYTSREVKRHSCNWRLDDVERLTKASYEVAIVPELHLKLEQLLKHVKDLAKQSAVLLTPVERRSAHVDSSSKYDDDAPITRRYVEAKRFLDQISSINVVIEGEGELAYRVAQHDRWQDYFNVWLHRSRLSKTSMANVENSEEPIACLSLIRKVGDRLARISESNERDGGLSSTNRTCICRSDDASDVVCSACESVYHGACLGLAPGEVKGRKAKTFVCAFCDAEKLAQLVSVYADLPDVNVMRNQMPRVAAPFGVPEAHQAILRAHDMALQFEAELERRINYDLLVDSRDPTAYASRLPLVVHLLKRALGIDFANIRVAKYNRSGVKMLAEIFFAHNGLGPEGQLASTIPWRGVAMGDPRFVPNVQPYNGAPPPAGVKQEITSSPATQPSPVPPSRPPGFVSHHHNASSSPHTFERSLPPPPLAHHNRTPLLPPPSYASPYSTSGPGGPISRHDDQQQRPMLPLPMHYSMRYDQHGQHAPPPPAPLSSTQPPMMRPSYQYGQHQQHVQQSVSAKPSSQDRGHSLAAMPSSDVTMSQRESSPQAAPSPNEDDGKDDGRKRKRGKRARFVFQEEVGIFVPVNGERIYCLCRRGETNRMISCDRCALWFHYQCVHVESTEDLGSERWICPMCCVKTERRYPFGEVKVKEMGVTDPTLWLDVRATLRSTRGPVSKLQHWTVGPDKRIVLHLESFYPATLPSAAHEGRDSKRQRSVEGGGGGEGNQGHVRSGSQGSASSSTATANANALGSVSRMPSWNDVRARITPANRTPSAEEHAARMYREAEERHRQGMANLYSRGVSDAMIQRWHIGWNGKELVYPQFDRNGVYHEVTLGTRIELARDDVDGTRFLESVLGRPMQSEQRTLHANRSAAPMMADDPRSQPPPSQQLSPRPSPKGSVAAVRPPSLGGGGVASSPQSTAPASLPIAKISRPIDGKMDGGFGSRPSPVALPSPLPPPTSATQQRPPPLRPPIVKEDLAKPEGGVSTTKMANRPSDSFTSPRPPRPSLPLATPPPPSPSSARPTAPVVAAAAATPTPPPPPATLKRSSFMVSAIPPFRASPTSAASVKQATPPVSTSSPSPRSAAPSTTITRDRTVKSPSLPALNVGGTRSPASGSPRQSTGPAPQSQSKPIGSPLHRVNAIDSISKPEQATMRRALMGETSSVTSPSVKSSKSPEEFRAIARMMKPSATDAEIEEMVRQALT